MRLRILDRYVALRFLAIYFASLASFTLIYVLVDSVSQYYSFAEKSSGFLGFFRLWARFYAAQVPIIFCRALGPVTAAASAAFTVTLFLRSNEFVPILIAGISLRRQAVPILILAGAAVLASAAIQELWIPAHREEIREARALGRGKTVLRHAKYYDAKRSILVVFRQYFVRSLRGEGLLVYAEAAPGRRGLLIEASTVRWVEEKGKSRPGHWLLEDAFLQEYDEGGNLVLPRQEGPVPAPPGPDGSQGGDPAAGRLLRAFPEVPLEDLVEIGMLPQDLQERESLESFLSIGEILRQVRQSPDSHRWMIRLLGRLVDPLHTLILVLLGISIILSRGTRNIFLSAISIMIVSALYFLTYLILVNLGNQGEIPPGLAAGLAPLLFGALGATLYTKIPT